MENVIISVRDLNVYYGDKIAVKDVSVDFDKNKITAIMGPSGCGKTTLLRCINRIHEIDPTVKITGSINLYGEDLMEMYPIEVRKKIGMVFQRPNPFPTMSIYDNVIAGYKLNGIKMKRGDSDELVEYSLKQVNLWEEVKSDLHKRGTFLSGGQQQRLCIARALAMKPEAILMDEPTSALDPISTSKIEELLVELKDEVTIIIVTHNLGQAGRISDYTTFMYLGELIEFGLTEKVFTNPQNEKTERFLTGKFG
ncbi:MAG TPA: phosphate ABC transporter ATP-binding protein PstB [Spirochaetota bacterium]|jgi:phosphate transport system ATP-binding protein|nr:MAG: Phosphate import ATP-binding protein PstB [Spirochaetes bacterium ADurb.Bin133]HNZ27927.1 phosphate ABC transporter ATP-binding protein PstB [Spirochaetota bacterium]HOE99890.1 phosphate ABC transporter ATP-binding protein PstB [Spirochaetota bacterium]HOS31810.1 phosphate ABC transporter ATP-binding protein PstB [Spirochaetota bacterium]HOS55582.1 phosphate ABC transporter ATP-binding protein PstB [Spirochaetota bacterium]